MQKRIKVIMILMVLISGFRAGAQDLLCLEEFENPEKELIEDIQKEIEKKREEKLRKEREERIREEVEENSYRESKEAAKIVSDVEHYGLKVLSQIENEVPYIKAELPPADAKIEPLRYSSEQRWWWTLLKQHKLQMNDTTVIWPKFLQFCVDVYNWADHTFNSYDPEYVVGTGKRWKARLVSDNWLDTYAMTLNNNNTRLDITMSSNVYANLGAYVQYMAVSVGFSYDVEKLFKGKEPSHKKMEFGFSCARFTAELYYHENKGGVNIRKFGEINDGKLIKHYFPGVDMSTLGVDAYYIFNNKKYSQGAAYSFAKYQLKSQGSFMAGFSFTKQKLNVDLTQLPENFKEKYPSVDYINYYFHYNSFAIMGGYGYNWVIAPKLLYNITVMPSIGFSHYYEDSLEGNKYLLSLNIQGRMSLTYNLGNYYFGIFGKMNGHWYKQGNLSLFSSIENFSAYVGLRF